MGLEDARLEHSRSHLTKGNTDEFGSDKSRHSGEEEEEEAAENEEDGVMERRVLKRCESTKTKESAKTEETAKRQLVVVI